MKFQDPPDPLRQRLAQVELNKTVEELKRNPGRWALVAEGVAPTKADAYKRRGCEITMRTGHYAEKNKADIYARWPTP